MNIRTAILAVCAGMLMLMATLARAGEPIPGVDIELGKTCPPYCGKPKATGALSGVRANGRSGKKITDNDSPRPGNRKVQQQKAGPGTGKSEIFVRWGNSRK
jgi:hypothetical protein